MSEQPEAERLAQAYADAVLLGEGNDEALAALLAHIQRGAVPEGYVAVPRFLAENHRNLTDVPRYQRILDDCFAAAPDHFRDAAEMVAVPSAFLARGARYKISNGTVRGLPRDLDGRWVALVAAEDDCHLAPAPADGRIAAAIHYPECWDTAAYPTVESALAEVCAHYRCTEHDAPAEVPTPEPVDDIDRALVPLSDHDRLTIGPGPWEGVRIGQTAFNVARAVFGTSSKDDDKRVYRTLQAYEQNRTQISGESTQADFERWLERDSTLPATRDGGTYSDFSVALMWHAWQECASCCADREAAGYARGLAEAGRDAEPVAYLYTLEYGSTVVNTKLSVHQLNYPFGVCGSDYLARSDDGVSYVRQTPLYTAAALRVEVKP